MVLSNKSISLWLNILYVVLIIVLGATIASIAIEGSLGDYFQPMVVLPSVGFVIILSIALGKQIINYNSEYDVIEIKSNHSFLSTIKLSNRSIVEFPKRKLHNYKIKGGLKKTLVIELKNKDNIRIQTVNLTFLSSKKRKAITEDLEKIKGELKQGMHLT